MNQHAWCFTYGREQLSRPYAGIAEWRWHSHTTLSLTVSLPILKGFTYQLYERRCWNWPPSFSIHFWHLFKKPSITRRSSRWVMLAISWRIFYFNSSRVWGFVLYTAFLLSQGVRSGDRGGHKSLLIILSSWNTLSSSLIEIFAVWAVAESCWKRANSRA